MIGAIIGDMIGSKYEYHNIRTKEFPLLSPDCDYTDDSLMTIAVGKALLRWKDEGAPLDQATVESMQAIGRSYPYPKGAYGGRFAGWLVSRHPEPYNSLGNGSAMRVSPCGEMASDLEEAGRLARETAAVTHNHPEGIRGAQAVAEAIFRARQGASIPEIRAAMEAYYPLNQTLAEIHAVCRVSGIDQLRGCGAERCFARRRLRYADRDCRVDRVAVLCAVRNRRLHAGIARAGASNVAGGTARGRGSVGEALWIGRFTSAR